MLRIEFVEYSHDVEYSHNVEVEADKTLQNLS